MKIQSKQMNPVSMRHIRPDIKKFNKSSEYLKVLFERTGFTAFQVGNAIGITDRAMRSYLSPPESSGFRQFPYFVQYAIEQYLRPYLLENVFFSGDEKATSELKELRRELTDSIGTYIEWPNFSVESALNEFKTSFMGDYKLIESGSFDAAVPVVDKDFCDWSQEDGINRIVGHLNHSDCDAIIVAIDSEIPILVSVALSLKRSGQKVITGCVVD